MRISIHRTFQSLTPNPESPTVSLHGGPTGYDAAPWTQLTTTPSLFTKAEIAHFQDSYAVFKHVSPNGDQGYPGELTIEVLVALLPPVTPSEGDLGSLIYVYRAKLDKGVTPVNLTQHWGFNLDASLKEHQGADVKDHTLLIKADRITKLDPVGLHTGEYTQVADAPVHDHTKGKRIGELYPYEAKAGGYDDFYVFADRKVDIPKRAPLSSLKDGQFDLVGDIIKNKVADPLVLLASEKSGLSVAFDSNRCVSACPSPGRNAHFYL